MGRMGRNRLGLERIILMIFRMGLSHSFFGLLSLSLSFPVPFPPHSPSVSFFSVPVSFFFLIRTCTHVIEPSSYVQYLISQQMYTSESKKERGTEREDKRKRIHTIRRLN